MKRIAAVTIAAVTLFSILAAGLLAAGCGGVPDDAVATVGDANITRAQFDTLISQAKAQIENQGTTFPSKGSATYDTYVVQIVDYLVQAEVVTQSADELGVTVTDSEVADQIAQIEKSYGGEKKVLALLKQQGMTLALLRQSIKEQLLTQGVATKVVAKAAVSDAQIEEYWTAHKETLRKAKKTATLAKAKSSIRQSLLTAAKETLWSAWLTQRMDELGVEYAAGYEPAALTASPSPSASAASGG